MTHHLQNLLSRFVSFREILIQSDRARGFSGLCDFDGREDQGKSCRQFGFLRHGFHDVVFLQRLPNPSFAFSD